jgi:tripartite-type tricarboxylate transporter receptor subunit TctC
MTTLTLDRRAITLGLAGVLCMPAILRAQTNLIVPFAAGGPTDAIARIYAEFISRISARRW